MMNLKQSLVVAVCSALCIPLISCSSSTSGGGGNNSYTPTTMNFKAGTIAYYELLGVGVPDSSGNNGDRIDTIGAQYNVQELVVGTTFNYKGYNNVTMNVFAANPRDTDYYYQDASGNLYRYNYGFSILNQYTFLTAALGSQIDVGWVLVAKPGSPAGTTWIGKYDSMVVQSYGIKFYLKDVATTMNDTTFYISTDTIKAQHIRHDVNAYTAPGGGQTTGEIVIDTYISPELGLTVEDFFHHSKIAGPLFNGQQRGSLKLMTLK